MNLMPEKIISQDEQPLIVLVHGYGAKRMVMWPLAHRLRTAGFRVIQWNYSSLFASIEHHAARLSEYVTSELTSESRIHFIAHSMGSIVTRAALLRAPVSNLGHVVLLAPPSRGSPVATLVSKLIGKVSRPTVELSSDATSYVNQLDSHCLTKIGIIAAKYDLLVPVENTHLKSETSHITLPATHNSLLLSRTACRHAVQFLNHGNFE